MCSGGPDVGAVDGGGACGEVVRPEGCGGGLVVWSVGGGNFWEGVYGWTQAGGGGSGGPAQSVMSIQPLRIVG